MFSLTKDEKRALIFLFCVTLAGSALIILSKSLPVASRLVIPNEDFFKIDLNRANFQELVALPGIGPKLANRIISRRQEQPFASPEELLTIPGITAARLEKIKNRIKITDE